MAQRIDQFMLKGGLDLTTPAIRKDPGSLLSCINYEGSVGGGYTRIQGYERFDGRPSPSEAVYYILDFTTGGTTPIAVGDSVLGGTSGTTSYVLDVVLTSGSWATSDAAGYLALTKVVGTWQAENIRDAGDTVTLAVSTAAARFRDAPIDADHIQYITDARELYRVDIDTVTGSGPIRGVTMFNGDVYAFRDNVGGTAGVMWKSSTGGWVAQDLGGSVTFDTGTTVGATTGPVPGATVTQAVSGATGVVIDTVYTGSWIAGTATGRIFLRTITGTFDGTNSLTWTGNADTAVATGAVVNSLSPGGRYEFVNYNFGGQFSSQSMYGVNGVDRGFQWDGAGFAFLYTSLMSVGAPTNVPTHIFPHKAHLFISVGSSMLHSSPGLPLDWSVANGAGEIATGDTITGFLNAVGNTLAIFDRNSTYLLSGSSIADWVLETHSIETGAVEWTCQNMGTTPKFLDDRGITSLTNTQSFGNFKASTLSDKIEPLLRDKLSLVVSSTRSREKNQYRLFFTDGTGVYMRSMEDRQGNTFTAVEFPNIVRTAASVEDTDGRERIFFGSDDGYVYEMDTGDTFDGAAIDYRLHIAFNNLKSPRNKKRFFKAVLDVDTVDVPSMSFIADYSYSSADIPGALAIADETLQNVGGEYDAFDNLGDFYWDGQSTGLAEAYLDGSGLNMSLLVTGSSSYEAPHRIQSATLHYGIRGIKI